jgi:hypothetical protein
VRPREENVVDLMQALQMSVEREMRKRPKGIGCTNDNVDPIQGGTHCQEVSQVTTEATWWTFDISENGI